ncbi:GroES-like protein, partial [Patellaria atrata CBS 101060]
TVFKSSADGNLVKDTTERKTTLNSHEVGIRITHSGVCGTDLHSLGMDIVLGHEGSGIVEEIGEKVQNFKAGDHVGFGYVKDGCGHCDYCQAGSFWHCKDSRHYQKTDFDQGSFSTYAVWPETLLVHIPEGMNGEHAAPFMCGGQTVWVPLTRYGIKPSDRVGIIGIGGLGHLAIQFAHKMGLEVVVFSSTESKREEAIALGASEFYAGDSVPEKGIDYLLVTTSGHPDWAKYMSLMSPFGHIFPLLVTNEPMNFPFMPFLGKELSFHGSCSSTPQEDARMMRFAALHGIKPVIEEFPMTLEGAKQALEKLKKGKVRYRAVL